MRELFPSSSAPKRPKLSGAFDPTRTCVALHQKQKKKAVRSKPSKVTVIVVQDASKGVPRGKNRKKLQEAGHIAKLEFMRDMSTLQVKNTIISGFQHLSLASFIYLTCDSENSHMLRADIKQEKDGELIVNAAQARKSTMYIAKCLQHVSVSVQAFHLLYTLWLSFTCWTQDDENLEEDYALPVFDLAKPTLPELIMVSEDLHYLSCAV